MAAKPDVFPGIDATSLLRRVSWRLMPFLFALYVCAYLDRVNLSFAALSIRRELGFSDSVYGAGAGLFFLSYALFEVPANLVLLRLGPRRWIALIMTAWGVLSTAMALVHSPGSFYLIRFLLGAAEAGFFPGILLYLTYWFPAHARARAVARFMTATAVAGIVGAPLSTLLLRLNGVAHLAGWKWLFIGEGLPSIVLGLCVLRMLTDRPEDATWLNAEEKRWLLAAVRAHEDAASGRSETHLLHAFGNAAVWVLASIYFAISVALYGLSLWLPVMVKSLSHASDLRVVMLTAVPYLLAAVAMLGTARSSDRTGERRWHLAGCLMLGAVAFGVCATAGHPLIAVTALFVSAMGVWGGFGPFWAMPTARLKGEAAAGGIALINSIGAVGGFCGPYLMGRVSDATHSFRAGLLVCGGLMAVAAVVASRLRMEPR
ncbi:MFS transporter [Silvibacterium sp.]|uniref:MFS transporter n=1 Tax=Silvibacterium sp. TaxID=1964179 RepID=UPI0039E65FEC